MGKRGSVGGGGDAKSSRSVREKSARYSTHEKDSEDDAKAFEKKELPPVAAAASRKKSERPLLRKSSSASLLDLPNGETPPPTAAGSSPFIRRKSNSLRDLTNEESKALKDQHEAEKAAIKKSKRSARSSVGRGSVGRGSTARVDTAGSLPPLTPKTTSREPSTQQQHPQQNRPKRRRRAGDIDLQRQPTIDVVVKYELGQTELKKFKLCFSQIDLDQSGFIDYDEFFEFIDERKTPFSEGLFRMIDADSNGTIDFEEFVHAMVMYCMYTRDEILQFAFDTFDPGKTGAIGEKEFKRLISLVNDGKPAYPGNFSNALAEFDRNKDGVIDFEEFKIMNKRYPMLLFPCFRLQDRMQKSTLGENHWHKLHKRLYDRLKLENYQRKHNGALPALGLVGSIRKFLGLDGRDIYVP